MKTETFFTERQRFNQWWLWLILLIPASFPVFGMLRELQSAQPFSAPEANIGFIISLAVSGTLVILFLLFRLDTQITAIGIYVRFFPVHFKYQQFLWSEMEQVYVRKYSPISEFGGWGLRYGLGNSGKAYNISGNQGIQIIFKNGKKLLIGTNKPEEAAAALTRFQIVQA